MRYAVNVPNFEDYSDVRTVAALAADAEAAAGTGSSSGTTWRS